jgi:hypothetical protein
LNPGADRSSVISKAVSLLVIGICFLASGCKDSAIIWSAESRSPDGYLVASANTEQFGGPGTAYVGTSVFLKQVNSLQPPTGILVLSNDTAYPLGITNVEMNWLTTSHLELTYKGGAKIDFQAVKCFGIDISVRAISSEATRTSQ